jgi:hypothetical protein
MVHPHVPYGQASSGIFFRIIAFYPVFKQPIRAALPLFLSPGKKALAATREKV